MWSPKAREWMDLIDASELIETKIYFLLTQESSSEYTKLAQGRTGIKELEKHRSVSGSKMQEILMCSLRTMWLS